VAVILCPTNFPPPSIITSYGKPYHTNSPKRKLITASSVALGKSIVSIVKIYKQPATYLEEIIHSPLTIAEALEFKDHTEDDVIDNFIN